MSVNAFPSLSSDGFIQDRSILSKKLFEMFLASDHSQSNFGDAQSLKYIINTETDDEYSKNEEIRKSLEKLYKSYFDSVIISVNNSTNGDNVVIYKIQIDASYNGNIYNINESVADNYYTDIDKFDAAMMNLLN